MAIVSWSSNGTGTWSNKSPSSTPVENLNTDTPTSRSPLMIDQTSGAHPLYFGSRLLCTPKHPRGTLSRCSPDSNQYQPQANSAAGARSVIIALARSEEHTAELQSLMRNSYAVFCLKTKTHNT